MDEPPIIEVSLNELRRMFNDGHYWERAKAGEFRQSLAADHHPTSPRAPVPYCTRSQIVIYYDMKNQRIAVVHQYLKPDGTLGASGRPDPKRLLINGIIYAVVEPAEKR